MFVGDANAEITNRWGKTCVDTCQSVANNQNARCTDELGNVDWCYRPHCSDYSRMYPGSNGLEMSFYARYKPNNIQVRIFNSQATDVPELAHQGVSQLSRLSVKIKNQDLNFLISIYKL